MELNKDDFLFIAGRAMIKKSSIDGILIEFPSVGATCYNVIVQTGGSVIRRTFSSSMNAEQEFDRLCEQMLPGHGEL